ncbi:MAG: Gfo/Idh/MocA family oxidoreductase [Armatimonadetes bacterium]|nr:Gfo/Idh/MocA family oxidoreductase [Armatimonadota bacterium]
MRLRYRTAIVGLGGIAHGRPSTTVNLPFVGQRPQSHSSAYERHPKTDLVAVCDLLPSALARFKELWDDVWPDLRYYTDYEEMLEKEQPEVVSVATPDHLHADVVVAAACGGARAIWCEKPVATHLAEADRMIAAAEENHVLLSVNHSRRWSSVYHTARNLIRSGELGRLLFIERNSFYPRAMLFRNGTHEIDMICFFAESDPVWVIGELEEGFDHFTEYRGDGGHDPATDPSASAYIKFGNGVTAFYRCAKTEATGSWFELVCEKGRITVTDGDLRLSRNATGYQFATSSIPPCTPLAEYELGALSELIHALENGCELVSSGREARKTLEIMLAILKSHELGNARVALPLGSTEKQ